MQLKQKVWPHGSDVGLSKMTRQMPQTKDSFSRLRKSLAFSMLRLGKHFNQQKVCTKRSLSPAGLNNPELILVRVGCRFTSNGLKD